MTSPPPTSSGLPTYCACMQLLVSSFPLRYAQGPGRASRYNDMHAWWVPEGVHNPRPPDASRTPKLPPVVTAGGCPVRLFPALLHPGVAAETLYVRAHLTLPPHLLRKQQQQLCSFASALLQQPKISDIQPPPSLIPSFGPARRPQSEPVRQCASQNGIGWYSR